MSEEAPELSEEGDVEAEGGPTQVARTIMPSQSGEGGPSQSQPALPEAAAPATLKETTAAFELPAAVFGEDDDDDETEIGAITEDVSIRDIEHYVQKKDEAIHITKLYWDKKGQYGQIRRLRNTLVARYLSGMIDKGPPRNHVRVLVLGPLPNHDNKYAVIGGQHVSAALFLRWSSYTKSKTAPVNDAAVPENYRYVLAEILGPTTPLHIARAAAGQHQALQTESSPPTATDLARYVAMVSCERENKKASPYLTLRDIWNALINVGLARRVAEEVETDESGNVREQEIQQVMLKQKQRNIQTWRTFVFFVAANRFRIEPIIDKIEMLNATKHGDTTEHFKATVLRNEGHMLTDEDMVELGSWLLGFTEKPKGASLLANQCKKLKMQRMCWYHLKDAPDSKVKPSKRNWETAKWMAGEITDFRDIKLMGRVGALWKNMKTDPDKTPGWIRLSKSPLWTSESRFGHIHRVLREEEVATVEQGRDLETPTGTVHQLSLDLGQEVTRVVYYGTAGAVCHSAKPSVLWIELGDHGLSDDQDKVLRDEPLRSAIVIGTVNTVSRAADVISKMPVRELQKSSVVYFFIDDEPILGQKMGGQENRVVVVLLICGSGSLRGHKAQVVQRGSITWRPSILAYLLNILPGCAPL